MATAVLDLELENLPAQVNGLDKYNGALILFRYRTRPVAKLSLPVRNGVIRLEDYHDRIMIAAGKVLSQEWVRHNLELDYKDEQTKLPSATVAVCTRNRTDDLRRCLDALMNLPDDGQEFLVVDNNPSDDRTRILVEAYPRVRYVCEMNPGLDFARNRAIREAKTEVVAFTDDDATPDKGWLRGMLPNFSDPLVGCVTGVTLPLELETDGQETFERYSSFDKGFVRIVHSLLTRNPLSTGAVGAGANMAIRKSIVDSVGYFDEALDAGTLTQSGGDHEYFARILTRGFKIVYEPAALSWHRHRRTMEETKKAIYGYGVGVYAFWTRCLLVEKEFGILRFPVYWFMHSQLPNLLRSLFRRSGAQPLQLVVAEIVGCIKGPWAYITAKRRLAKRAI